MNFTHPHFFIFFLAFLIPYFLTKGKERLFILLIASYCFYAYFSLAYCLLLLISTLADYIFVKKMTTEESKSNKRLLICSVCFNLGLLAVFKYKGFFWNDCLAPLTAYMGFDLPVIEKSLPPVGISFFTFQTMSYSIDVYRGHLNKSQSFLQFAVYVSMFPQLVAGPIVRAKDLLFQISEKIQIRIGDIRDGLKRFIWGFFKKACIADTLALTLVDPVFLTPENYSPFQLCLGVLAYSFQIYFDFSGYSDMAIGVGRMIGFKFPENFKHPYQSKSFSEFWTRWHISLSSWLRDYLYISMGGSRSGAVRTLLNLMITMLLGGLWHGASFLFIFWGFMHGVLLIIERLILFAFPKAFIEKVPGIVKSLLVFLSVTMCWIPFRSQKTEDMLIFMKAPFNLDYGDLLGDIFALNIDVKCLLLICFVSHFFRVGLMQKLYFKKWPFELKLVVLASLLFFMIHYYPDNTQEIPFIYFRF
jgi:alginate O-acetyltransferase complex protein AlgI